ncbi:MAG: uroporphyrinogen decarboxylase family protein [Armatimonadota bacterium]
MHRSRERVLRILRHDGPGLVAYDALRSPAVREVVDSLDLPEKWRAYFREGDIRYVGAEPPGERERFAGYLPDLPAEAQVSCWGVGRIALQNAHGHHAGHRYFHPLADIDTIAGLDVYPWPDPGAARDPDDLRAEVASLQSEGFAVIGNASQTVLETAYLMRGIDRLFLDFYERPDYLDALFAKLTEQRIVQMRALARAGVDAIRIGDDIATQEALMISPPMYRERLKPHHSAAVRAAREVAPDLPVAYHSDGDITALLPDLVEIGVTAINPVQPECMDLRAVSREFGADLALWGCTPVQSTYAHGTPEQVREHTRFLFNEIAPARGLIVQFMNIVITPHVLESLRAFFEKFAGREP